MCIGDDIRSQLILDGGPLLNKLLQGRRPMFLGLEGRLAKYYDEFSISAEFFLSKSLKSRAIAEIKELLDGFENCQKLIEIAFRYYRRASDGCIDRLLHIVVESTFEYIEFDEEAIIESRNTPD